MPDWTIEVPAPRVEPSPRWVRVRAGEQAVADSRRALLLSWYGPGMLPTYCFPAQDVRADLLQDRPETPAVVPFASVHDVVVGEQRWAGAAVRFQDPPKHLAALDGCWTFSWEAGLTWWEEALQVHVHARDPRGRVDAVPSERHVRVELDGELLAESRRPLAVFETGLPTRWYLPPEDVRQDLLVASDTTSRCPYKGTAAYWSVRVGEALHPDLVWSYADPVVEAPRLAGLLAFLDERVDVTLEGERQDRPRTPWSP